MKKIKRITLLSMCAIMIFTSCKKESNLAPENCTDNQTTQKLIDFKSKLVSKDGNSLNIESATWSLEGLLNYENANNEHNLNNLIHYYDTLSFNLPNTTITYTELNELYSLLVKKLNIHQQITPNSKFDLIDLEIMQTNNQTNVIMVSSTGVEISKLQYNPFTSTDYWRWGFNQGKCDGTCVGSDAADQLKYRFNNPVNVHLVIGYYTGIVSRNEYFNSHPLPDGRYIMFMTTGPGSSPGTPGPCISPEELNFFLSHFDFIKDINCPAGKKFKNANVVEDIATMDNNWAAAHFYQLFYGTFTSGASSN